MRLETEVTTAAPPFDTFAEIETKPGQYEESLEHLTNGIRFAQRGDRVNARTSLLRCTELDPRNENAWLWLASISEYPEELLVFLNNVLEINPSNTRALEWRSATNSLLAKTFVQRGIDAVEENHKEHAAEYFSKALEYEQNNSLAWMWMASLSDSHDGQLLYLEKALAIDPANEAAQNAYKAVKQEITSRHLADAKTAAVSGRLNEANELLEAVLAEMPDSEDAWMLKSHFAVSFDEKISSFERVLQINPDNLLASTSLASLRSLVGETQPVEAVAAAPVEVADPVFEEEYVSETLSFEPVAADSENENKQDMSVAFFENYNNDGKGQYVDYEVGSPADLTPATEEVVDHETASEDVLRIDAEQGSSVTFESHEEVSSNEYFASPTETMLPVSLEVPEYTNSYEAVSESQSEFAADQSLENDVEPDRSSASASADTSTTDRFFDDDSIEEIRPSYDHIVSQTVSESFETKEEIAEQPEPYHTNGNSAFDPTITLYSPSPVIFEPSVTPAETIEDDASDEEESPLPFGNTLMFSLEADGLTLKEETDPSTSNGYVDAASFEPAIPMPTTDDSPAFSIPMPSVQPHSVPEEKTGFETTVMTATTAETEKKECVYCTTLNDGLAVSCQNCLAVLTLSDIEMLLSNQNADRTVLRDAVEKMETRRGTGELSEYETTMLGIAYLNMKDLETGYARLNEASQLNPNNVILAGQVNAIHIRVEEIRAKETENGTHAKGKTILVVDDSPTIRKLISGKLEKSGHEVFCSADGVDAMEQLAVLRPDLILLDITMPRMDGYQVCKLIRSTDATKDVPVVMISGKDGFFDKVRGRMAGSSGYITKPFGPETLMKIVETYLNNGH